MTITFSKPRCVVIMPFGIKSVAFPGRRSSQPDRKRSVDFNATYDYLIGPAIASAGLLPERADRVPHARITNQIVRSLLDAPYVLADLTSLNPNVFYELGVRHALKRCTTIMIAASGTSIPFDVSSHLVFNYATRRRALIGPHVPNNTEVQIDALARFIEGRINREDTDSIVREALPGLHLRNLESAKGIRQKRYEIPGHAGKSVQVVPGNILDVKEFEAWTNSENTHMEMARWNDASMSSIIRYHGAVRRGERVTDDVVYTALRLAAAELIGVSETSELGQDRRVPEATAIATTSGQLMHSNGVKTIIHVASVNGSPGRGFTAIADISSCVTNALLAAHRSSVQPRSILMPLFGAGTARRDPSLLADMFVYQIAKFFRDNPATCIETVGIITRLDAEAELVNKSIDKIIELATNGKLDFY